MKTTFFYLYTAFLPLLPSNTSLISLNNTDMSLNWDSQASQNTSRFSFAILLDGCNASVSAAEIIWTENKKFAIGNPGKKCCMWIHKCLHRQNMKLNCYYYVFVAYYICLTCAGLMVPLVHSFSYRPTLKCNSFLELLWIVQH